MENARRPQSRRTPAQRALTVSLPTRLVSDAIRLAELMGTPFQVEIAVTLGLGLTRLAESADTASQRADARALSGDDVQWERVRVWLPAERADQVRAIARAWRVSQSKAIASLLAPVIAEHLAVATYALERRLSFSAAHATLVAAPVPAPPAGAKRRAPKKRSA